MDYTSLVTSEHATKPKFMALVNLLANGLADIAAVVRSIPQAFDLDTAIGAQLDTVGLWVGQSRVITGVLTVGFFGFADNIAAKTFGELGNASVGGPFWNLGEEFSTTTVLGDALYRQFLYAKILRNQSHGTAEELEQALADILGVPVTLQDPGTLTVGVTALGNVPQVLQVIVQQYDILPRPACVNFGYFSFPSQFIQPGTGAMTYVGQAGRNQPVSATPGVAAITYAGAAPGRIIDTPKVPATGAETFVGVAPTRTP
jgi:hypothetical protein